MSDLYEEYGLEMEEPAHSFSYKPEKKKKGGWLGRIIALLLGFVIGIGACVGAVCAILFSPVSTPLSLMGLSQEDQKKLISQDYLDDSILSIVNALSQASQQGTIAAYDAISPAIGTTLREFSDKLKGEMGIDLNKNDQLIDSKIADLPITLSDSVKSTPVGNIFRASNGGKKLDPMLMEICYGEEGTDYIYDEDGEVKMLGNAQATTLTTLSSNPNAVIDRVTISAVVDPNPDDTVMLAIAYGQSGITYELAVDDKGEYVRDADGRIKVEMLQKFLEKDKSGAFIDHNGKLLHCEETPATNDFIKIKEYKADADNNLVLDKNGDPILKDTYYVLYNEKDNRYYAYERPDEDKPLAFEKTAIGDMTEDSRKIIDNLLLKDVIDLDFSTGEEPNGVLVSLAYGEEGVDFEYTYDKNGKITGVEPINDPRTIGQLRSRGDQLINDIPLHEILSEDRNNAIIMHLLYGKEGLHYVIDPTTNEIKMNSKFIVQVGGALYNEYGELLQKRHGNPGDKDYKKGYLFDDETYTDRRDNVYTYEEALTLDASTKHETALSILKNLDISIFDGLDRETLDQLGEKILENLDPSIHFDPDSDPNWLASIAEHLDPKVLDDLPITFYYLYDEDGNQVNFPKTSLGDLAYSDNPITNLTKHMTVVEVLGEDSIRGNKFLKHVADYTIDELPQAIDELTFAQVFEADMFIGTRYQPTEGQDKSYIDANGHEVHEGDFIDENGNFVPMEEREMKGIWKYLLHQGENPDGTPIYHYEYKVTTEMNAMLDNMTDNIQHATLNDLEKDEIMDFDDEMLNTPIKTKVGTTDVTDKDGNPLTYEGKNKLGQLTVLEMLEYTSALLDAIPD